MASSFQDIFFDTIQDINMYHNCQILRNKGKQYIVLFYFVQHWHPIILCRKLAHSFFYVPICRHAVTTSITVVPLSNTSASTNYPTIGTTNHPTVSNINCPSVATKPQPRTWSRLGFSSAVDLEPRSRSSKAFIHLILLHYIVFVFSLFLSFWLCKTFTAIKSNSF